VVSCSVVSGQLVSWSAGQLVNGEWSSGQWSVISGQLVSGQWSAGQRLDVYL